MESATAFCAGSSCLSEISFTALVKCVFVALFIALFRLCFLSAVRAALSADVLLGNRISFLSAKAGFGLTNPGGAYDTTYTVNFR